MKKKPPAKKRPERKRDALVPAGDGGGLTRARMKAILRSIKKDRLPRKYAATANGVSPSTLENWIMAGAAGLATELHVELAREVHQLEAKLVGGQMRNLDTLGAADPKAAVSFLQFFKPKDFGGTPPVGDEFQEPARNAQRQDLLLSNPPPRMLAKFREHGWWKFATEIEEEDRMVLIAIQEKYALRQQQLPASTEGAASE